MLHHRRMRLLIQPTESMLVAFSKSAEGPLFLQRCQGFRGAAQAELRTLQMASCCVTQITGPQLIQLGEAALVVVIREI